MTFFENQRSAKNQSTLLLLYLFIAVISIIGAIYLASVLTFLGGGSKLNGEFELWHPQLFGLVSFITLLIVISGSLYKIIALRGGGERVALALGGRLIQPGTNDPAERKILNVVEEVAIASGVAVPPVYLLDHEDAINAFAAGYRIDNAVIGVTKGCVQLLSRDELQGVIAHEFSHIINGDMRLNIQLIGVLNGILIIGLTGYWLLRTTTSSRRRSSNGKNSGGGIALFGLCLFIIGYLGVFFARLIKAAVSRQREYLADASAVQFTRNPGGISGALKKIGGYMEGSRISSPSAEEASHMFFANGLTRSFFRLLATHPPLTDRIQQIDPSFKGEYPQVKAEYPATDQLLHDQVSGFAEQQSTDSFPVTPAQVVQQIGEPTERHLAYAGQLINSLPERLISCAHDPFDARVLVFALLLDRDTKIRGLQLQLLGEHEDSQTISLLSELSPLVDQIKDESHLSLIDLCIPALKLLSRTQYNLFNSAVKKMVNADKHCSLFEYTLHHILARSVSPDRFNKPDHGAYRYSKAGQLVDARRLLAILATAGNSLVDERVAAFERGQRYLPDGPSPSHRFDVDPSLDQLDTTLTALQNARPELKEQIIAACTAVITHDGWITVEEAQILRAICDALLCPLPPFIPGAIVAD